MEFVVLALTILYLVPWMVAEGLEHPRRYWILALVVATGWTVVGWIAALAWALAPRLRRAPVRPALHVVGRPPPAAPLSPWRRARPWLLRGAIALVFTGGAVWLATLPPERMAATGTAQLLQQEAVVRAGPGERWQPVGTLAAPCTVRLLESEGAWLRFWRMGECPGSMRQGSGWVRDASLVRLDGAGRE